MVKAGVIITLIILVVIVGGFFLSRGSGPTGGGVLTGDVIQQQESQPLPQVREFDVTAKRWTFDPQTITVNQGDTVILNIHSIDVTHGIAIPDFGVNRRLSPGNTVRIEFIADKKGSFSFFCSVSCGAGHTRMRGTLIVE